MRFVGTVMHSATHAVGWAFARAAPSKVTKNAQVRAVGSAVAASVESGTALVNASAAATREIALERANAAEMVALHQTGSAEAAAHAREAASIAVDVADVGHQMALGATPHGAAAVAVAHEHLEREDRIRQQHGATAAAPTQHGKHKPARKKKSKRLPQVYVVDP